PKAKVVIIDSDFEHFLQYVSLHDQEGCYGMVFDKEQEKCPVPCLTYGASEDSEQQAKELFETLRKFDELNASIVFARCPSKEGVGLAVYNRLLRAAGFEVVLL
ncbi:MAG: threonylcarbamoyl-AMP synthase, partial [Oscillospiraceae bacterium]|nr:threonylcarbamoyl-AMP synthase [Oscillospiraceae bacterium]